MCCELDIPCSVKIYPPYSWPDHEQSDCLFCVQQGNGVKTAFCGPLWVPGPVYGCPTSTWVGHGTTAWLLKHVDDPEPLINEALILAKDWYRGRPPDFDGRGHYVLRNYDGHWALERFLSSQTIPFSLSNMMTWQVNEAVQWFFDSSKTIPEPGHCPRVVDSAEVIERIDGYQKFIDKETARSSQTRKALPPLRELPFEQQRRLVQGWEFLWWHFLDGHPKWRWTPLLGFWKADERVFSLV